MKNSDTVIDFDKEPVIATFHMYKSDKIWVGKISSIMKISIMIMNNEGLFNLICLNGEYVTINLKYVEYIEFKKVGDNR